MIQNGPGNYGGITFDKRIGLDTLIAFATLFFIVLGVAVAQDRRVTITETQVKSLEATDARIETQQKSVQNDITKRLDRMEEKLDRLVGRR